MAKNTALAENISFEECRMDASAATERTDQPLSRADSVPHHNNSPSAGAQLATLSGFTSNGTPLVRLLNHDRIREALSTIPITQRMVGKNIVILFEYNGAKRPIIIGLLPDADVSGANEGPVSRNENSDLQENVSTKNLVVTADGETVVLSAQKEIQLRCGDASITLTRAGKVIIKGEYLLSRSRGANKIKGAYVDIN